MDADALQPLYVLLGTSVVAQLIAAGFALVRWSAKRSVAREDQDKQELKERAEELENKHHALERAVIAMTSDMKQLSAQANETRGAVAESKAVIDVRFDKQSDFYRTQQKELVSALTEKMEKLEFTLRQDTTRAIHDAQTIRSVKRGKGAP